jgi:tetratricopeptide (TPR) repeat protein
MISILEAFGWLNVDDRSHLSNVNTLSLFQLQDPNVPAKHKESMMRELRATSHACQDPQEGLEVLMNLARLAAEVGDYPAARQDLVEAIRQYRPVSHRSAVARWMLGIVEWKQLNHNQAYANWFRARELFQMCAEEKGRVSAAEMARWYYQQIDRMRVDMACTAEEANYWLSLFEPSRLNDQAKQFAQLMTAEIVQKKFSQAYEIGNKLAAISRAQLDPSDTAEVWVTLGLAAHQMGNPRKEVEYWTRGAAAFNPWSHPWAVTRWMIGVALWGLPDESDRAIRSWKEASETFQELRIQADREGDASRRDWYDNTARIMKQALEQMVREKIARPA